MKRTHTLISLIACVAFGVAPIHAAAPAKRPNIVVIMADDMGYSDLRCFGGEIDTPNLDQLAAKGIRFSRFTTTALCGPSRACLLSGMYPHRVGVGHNLESDSAGYRRELSLRYPTVAETLHSGGYRTYMVGKWDVTRQGNMDAGSDKSTWPNQRGFDRFFGTLHGTGSFWDPVTLVEDNKMIRAQGDFYYTEAITAKAVTYIRDPARHAQTPFFLYVAYTAPHYPLHAREERIRKYRGRFDAGWDELRVQRHQRQQQMGLIPAHAPLARRDEMCVAWKDEPHKEWEAHRMEVYAAMIDHMDEGVGRIVEALSSSGQLERTLIFFLSDNGASPEAHPNGRVERSGVVWRNRGIPATTRDGRPLVPGNFHERRLGADDSYGSYGAKWAHLSNTPFARFKSWVHNGGIVSPLIVHWPAGLTAGGIISRELSHLADIAVTCLDVAGIAAPREFRGEAIASPDGRSLLPVLKGETRAARPIFWEMEGNRAGQSGRWKIVSEYKGEWQSLRRYARVEKWELYDMEQDPGETIDLAERHPEIVRQLSAQYDRWAAEVGVERWDQIKWVRGRQ